MQKKIRILHIIKSLGRGGAEMLLPETLALHDKDIFEFHYIYFLPWKNQVVPDIESNKGIVKCLKAANNIKIFLSIRKIAAYCRENQVDIIHCHLPWAGIAGRMAGKIRGIPVMYTEHNKWERYHRLTYYLNKVTFGWQQVVVPCSNDVEVSIRKFYKRKKPAIKTISNGVNTNKFLRNGQYGTDIRKQLRISEDTRVIGVIAVFRTQKRLSEWLKIARQIHESNKKTFFLIVGDGPLNHELRHLANQLQMEDYLQFAGLQSEVRPYLQAMDIFMMTSEFEGLPIALLEAMSMGCIPACTAAGGIPEVISSANGILVDVDKPQALLDNVLELVNSWETVGMGMSVQARDTVVQKFSLNKMVNELENLYTSIL